MRLSQCKKKTLANSAFDTGAFAHYSPPPFRKTSRERPENRLAVGKGDTLNSSQRVLIVDESADAREVLRTLLEERGATTIEAQRPEQAVKLVEFHQPDLIVLDAESDRSASGSATHSLQAVASRSDTPIVILGTLRPQREQVPAGQVFSKPYHYGPLIRRIRDLLDAA